jgi:hypothetical protein
VRIPAHLGHPSARRACRAAGKCAMSNGNVQPFGIVSGEVRSASTRLPSRKSIMPTTAPYRKYLRYRPVEPRPHAAASDRLFSLHNRRCPECGDMLTPVHRRGVGDVLSFFVSMRRYRCPNVLCAWEGNLREGRTGTVRLSDVLGYSVAPGHKSR